MAVWRGARPGKGRGQKRTKFPWEEVGEGIVRRQSSGEPRPGIPDLGISGRWPPTPYSSLARRNPQNTSRRGFSSTGSLKTLPDTVLLPRGPKPFSSDGSSPGQSPHTCPFEFSLLLSARALSPTAPSICSSAPLTSFSPQPVPRSLSPLRPPSAAPFLQPWRLREGGPRQRREWAAEGRRCSDTDTGWLQRRRQRWEEDH